MKKATIIKLCTMIVFSILMSVFVVSTYASSTNDVIVLKKSEKRYLIYYKELCNSVFQFAISDKIDTDVEELTFINSAKDSTNEGALYVAFIDETNYSDGDMYIWVKDDSDNLVIEGEKIDLTNPLDDDIIEFINTTTIVNKETDRIKVDTTQTQTTNTEVDGVDTTITTGKMIIDGNTNSKYSYVLYSANDKTSNAGKIYELSDKINNFSGNSYEKLELAREFYNLYILQMPKDSEWKNIENNTILQPEDTVAGDKFIVYIKAIKDN